MRWDNKNPTEEMPPIGISASFFSVAATKGDMGPQISMGGGLS